MAPALTVAVPPPPPPPLPPLQQHNPPAMDSVVVAAAAAVETLAKPSSPRPIPSAISIPPPALSDDRSSMSSDALPAAGPSPSRQPHASPPPPIPDFVFPARPSTSAPSSYSRATGRRPRSVADLQDRSGGGGSLSPYAADPNPPRSGRSPPLPDFVFNPGANLSPASGHAFLSPPQSPQSPRAIPVRPGGGGHRRGGSEFVGGSLRPGEPFTLMSTSPTKSESGLASPSLSPANSPPGLSGPTVAKPAGPPPGARRGHAHRRSAAISSHDLSVILQPTTPSPPARGSSAPSSPSGFLYKEDFRGYTFPDRGPADGARAGAGPTADAESSRALAAPGMPQPAATPAPLPAALEAHQRFSPAVAASKPTHRARVGFSDTLEFIPRPLSLVSSDTSSTITARPTTGGGSGSHSVSGSISSIISLNASMAPAVERDAISPLARSPSRSSAADSRPSTAGAVLDRTQSITADDNADGASPRRRNSIPLLAFHPNAPSEAPSSRDGHDGGSASNAAQALPSPNKTPKRWSFFSLDPFIGSGSLTSPTRPFTSNPVFEEEPPATVDKEVHTRTGFYPTAKARADRDLEPSAGNSSSPSRTVGRKTSNKKKKKAKSWGILGRKSKPRRKSRRAPTPPPIISRAESDDDESIEVRSDNGLASGERADGPVDPPVVLVTPSGSPSEPQDALTSWKPLPSPSLSVPDDDASFPMIDLDAALGPFNTPLPRNAEWEAAQRAGGLSKRQLHSAAGMTRFSGPGMHYSHRRAESAPEMPPFNRAGIPRFSSSTAMADVFEEEEEEEDGKSGEGGASKQQSAKPEKNPSGGSKPASVYSTASACSAPQSRSWAEVPAQQERPPSIDIRVTSTDGGLGERYDCGGVDFSAAVSDDATSSGALSRRGSGLSGLSDDDKTQPSTGLKSEYSASSLHDASVESEAGGYAFGEDGCEIVMESSSDSTIHSPGALGKGKDLAPVDVSPLHLPTGSSLAPVSPYSMATSSALPSPRSPMSYDANRISTAPSSVTEDNFRSLLLGEPGPEVRISSDIPSLTSSNSTMTRESAVPHAANFPLPGPQPRPFLPSRGGERPASFTSTAFGRRRSSLASLHRLISTSHGERSKLSIEVQPDSASTASGGDPERRTKASKAKRLSRMMQFWRGKDEATS